MIARDSSRPAFFGEAKLSISQWIQFLSLDNFRCYGHLTLEVDQRPVVLTGQNGAGKTNILEALSFLSPGRGLRGSKLSHVSNLKYPEKGWTVFSKVFIEDTVEQIGTGILSGDLNEGKRVIKLNQNPLSQTDLLDLLTVFWITPQTDQLLNESMGTRRRFFDKMVASFFPTHSQHLYRYEYALRERARLLKEGGREKEWLSVLEQKMAQESIAITSLRQIFLDEISPLIKEFSSALPKVDIFLEGLVETLCLDMPALEAEEKIQALLGESRRGDSEGGSCQIGPHQTKVQFFYREEKKFAEFCSTGEQKALLLSLILANCRLHKAKKGKTPIMLLDEIVAHLDEGRRESLYREILNLGVQCWMTGTEESVFRPLGDNAQYLFLKDRSINKRNNES